MFLVDTNVWLELLLEQEKAGETRSFLQHVSANQLAITEFSLYSMAIILCQLGKEAVLTDFLSDTFGAGVSRIVLGPDDFAAILDARQRLELDFDDAYQHAASQKHDLDMVSFDRHFDRTTRGRLTPAQAMARHDTHPA
ncbi:type II toxin-antitoxin system VapC family toxin [bacterium]|nr:type II toxin-antitoxin system VapC family toxin [bacterium]